LRSYEYKIDDYLAQDDLSVIARPKLTLRSLGSDLFELGTDPFLSERDVRECLLSCFIRVLLPPVEIVCYDVKSKLVLQGVLRRAATGVFKLSPSERLTEIQYLDDWKPTPSMQNLECGIYMRNYQISKSLNQKLSDMFCLVPPHIKNLIPAYSPEMRAIKELRSSECGTEDDTRIGSSLAIWLFRILTGGQLVIDTAFEILRSGPSVLDDLRDSAMAEYTATKLNSIRGRIAHKVIRLWSMNEKVPAVVKGARNPAKIQIKRVENIWNPRAVWKCSNVDNQEQFDFDRSAVVLKFF